jgi:enamine deaminase RidA (YjgF/YER057c/UK114 family)
MNIDERLAELGIVLPEPTPPIAAYVPAVQTGHLLVISGQLPMRNGELLAKGRVPSIVSIAEAQAAARQCAINALAIVKAELGGDWTKLRRIVRLGVFVQCDNDFNDHAKVANGASELLADVLGEAGRHARAAVGVNALPLGATVEVEMMVELVA